MSIADFIASKCVQTAVYWGNPRNDGYNHFTFDEPVEISCRWEDKEQVLTENDGTKYLSRAIVFLTQDVDVEGRLWLGTLAQLENLYSDSLGDSSGVVYNPEDIENVCIVKRFEKTPGLGSTTDFLHKAFLTPWLT